MTRVLGFRVKQHRINLFSRSIFAKVAFTLVKNACGTQFDSIFLNPRNFSEALVRENISWNDSASFIWVI